MHQIFKPVEELCLRTKQAPEGVCYCPSIHLKEKTMYWPICLRFCSDSCKGPSLVVNHTAVNFFLPSVIVGRVNLVEIILFLSFQLQIEEIMLHN